MHRFQIGFSLFFTFGLAFCACGQSSGGSTGSGGAGGGVDCRAIALVGGSCDDCLHQQCCAELAACYTLPKCFFCSAWDPGAAICMVDPDNIITNVLNCGTIKCPAECGGPYDPGGGGAGGGSG